ncbi:MAG: tripartite tricarboxylate transporter TctB family protein [Desulfobacteraceae bacterium]|nr:MAG: tripartite tricarboxylate transporter TctB family protein [Desulfobacteraceae bacterium]
MNRHDFVSGLFWLSIALFVLTKAFELGVGAFSNPAAGFVLFWSSILLAILSVVVITKSVIKDQKKQLVELWTGLRWGNVLIAVILLILYGLVLPRLGFVLTVFGFLVVLFILGGTRFWIAVVSAILTVAASYFLFHTALQVQFPRGPFGW